MPRSVSVVSQYQYGGNFGYLSLFDGSDWLLIDGISRLSVTTGAGSDNFDVTPFPATTITVNGGDPTPPSSSGDTLNLRLAGAEGGNLAVSNDASGSFGSWTFTNRQPVIFKNFETLTPANSSNQAGVTVNATEDDDVSNLVVARFFDPNVAGPLSDYSASIDWGDGYSTSGVVGFDAASGLFSVSGNHRYLEDGNDTILVTVHRKGFADISMVANAVVAEAPIQGISVTLLGTAGVPLATSPAWQKIEVARFTQGGSQGQRTLSRLPRKDFDEEVVVPSAAAPLHSDAILARMLFQKVATRAPPLRGLRI